MFRYPGGKSNLRKCICGIINNFLEQNPQIDTYVEPFFGGGSIGLEMLKNRRLKNYFFCDVDVSLVHLWKSIHLFPDDLIEIVSQYVPTVESYFEIKDYLNNIDKYSEENGYDTISQIGFRKLAIHQISYSGLGTKSGGPIGGIGQNSDYKIGCRWNTNGLIKKIKKLNTEFRQNKVNFMNLNFVENPNELSFENDENCFWYLDPPYYIKGGELYQFSFSKKDHSKLREILSEKKNWILSYDDCKEIRNLYSDFVIKEVNSVYTINTARKKQELIIAPQHMFVEKKENYLF